MSDNRINGRMSIRFFLDERTDGDSGGEDDSGDVVGGGVLVVTMQGLLRGRPGLSTTLDASGDGSHLFRAIGENTHLNARSLFLRKLRCKES